MSIQYFLPQRLLSWITRKLTQIETIWIKNLLIKGFTKLYPINWDESLHKDPNDFPTFNAFFTRELTTEARPIHESQMILPADGKIVAFGQLQEQSFIHAKGHHFTLDSLLADPTLAQEFSNGNFTTVYLSPRDYHRVHMPIDGNLIKSIHIPGKLYSVSLKTASQISDLFAQNERFIAVFDTKIGKVAVILVGAINVSSMQTVWSGLITPPYATHINYKNHLNDDTKITLKKGEEMGRFNMGSTVIVLTQSFNLKFDESIIKETVVKMGQALLN